MQNKMICFFIDSLFDGGAERVVSVLANNFIAKGYKVDIIMLYKRAVVYTVNQKVNILFADDMPVNKSFSRFIRKSFNVWNKFRAKFYIPFLRRLGKKDYPKWNETKFFFYAKYAMPYREYLKQNRDITAFGFLIRSNISMLMAAKRTGIKTVFCERNNPVRPDMPKNIIKLRDKYYKRCKAAVFQTEEERDYYTKLKCPAVVIPNPIKEGLPEQYIGERRHEIVNFCRLNKQKNIPLLIDAFEMFLSDFPDYTLKIYGRGEEKENISEYIRAKNLETKVILEDFAVDIHDRIRDSAMFVSTSDFEGLSNSMLEAMAIGLPCICTDCDGGGARMMIKNHVNGLLVPKGDTKAVYEAMKEIVGNASLAEKLSVNAAKIKEDLSVNKIVDRWIKMI